MVLDRVPRVHKLANIDMELTPLGRSRVSAGAAHFKR